MGKIHEIVFDCEKPATLAAFWASLLDGYSVRGTDPLTLAALSDLGLQPVPEPTVVIDGPGPSICFQNIDGRRPDNNRVHFDIAVDDRAGLVATLTEAGAETVRVLPTYTVMRDPEGNQFVIVDTAVELAA